MGGADRRGFSWRAWYARKEWLKTCAQRGGDSLDARRNKEEGGRKKTVQGGVNGGGEPGTVPSNNDWVPRKSGGEERAARFLTGSLRDRYGLFPARYSQTAMQKKNEIKRIGRLFLRKEGCPRIMIQLQERFCARRESFKTAVVFVCGG